MIILSTPQTIGLNIDDPARLPRSAHPVSKCPRGPGDAEDHNHDDDEVDDDDDDDDDDKKMMVIMSPRTRYL